ncbi:putative transposase [Bradyrhizobium sp. NFR13]|uniref:DDE-type integrase/transposase/recombinase n=1 Tax=Bradyrhizobium sp. NFR13 TaxID=1566285 RepID=UPI0008E18FAC|nr:DDE-type integrase/transposase/recombinase [Bradyrhizobium sp. NFR13]SFM13652.1 putative transposase [Bradyrhizobium sp. NFR13]
MNALFPPSQASAQPAAHLQQAVSQRFDLRSGEIVSIYGHTCIIDRRLDGLVYFIDLKNKDFHSYTDQQLAFLSAEGQFRFVAGAASYGKSRGPIPNRITLTDAQLAEADRKLTYINACLDGHLADEEEKAYYEFKRTRVILEPIIARVAESRAEKGCHFNTVLDWIDRWLRLGELYGKSALVNRHHLKGNRKPTFDLIGDMAIERGLWRWLTPNMTKEIAYAKVVSTVNAYKRKCRRYLTEAELLLIETPSFRTFQRRCASIDKYTRDYYRKGPYYANRVHKIYRQQALPERPNQFVEVDHCTLDVELLDESANIRLGRPDLIIFRCRATGMVIGYNIGWEVPSYASFVAGLRHAMYPKDLSAYPAVTEPWPCWGRIENLGVDNALHFVGDDIRDAGRELKMEKVRFRPRCPWLKGALERFFGSLNTGLVHHLSGTTLSNIIKRSEHDDLGPATLTLKEFEALLVYWIVMIHNRRGSKGLGVIRGIGDVPIRLWNEKAALHPAGPLPPPDLFIALAGEWEMRTIQNDGIVWDYLTYECPELLTLTTHPLHRSAREHGSGTLYKCCRDPSDLGRIYVVDPYNPGNILTVPATQSHFPYANGRHRHSHSIVVAEAGRKVKDAIDFDELMKALDRLGDALANVRDQRERKQIHRKLGRFIGDQRRERLASRVTPSPTPRDGSGSEHLDPIALGTGTARQKSQKADGAGGPSAEAGSTSSGITRQEAGRPHLSIGAETVDDLAALKAEKNWSASDG